MYLHFFKEEVDPQQFFSNKHFCICKNKKTNNKFWFFENNLKTNENFLNVIACSLRRKIFSTIVFK